MADQVTNYKCLACGGSVHFDGATGKLKCDYCESTYSVEEMEAAMKAENEKAVAAMEKAEEKAASSAEESWGADGMKTYSCPSCGAELICDSTTAATCCPYCGNQTVIPGQFTGSLEPEFVIPFKTDREQAKAALINHYKGKKLLPNSFVSGNHIEDIQGVYVPFWMFDCEFEGDVSFEATTSTTHRSGKKETTTTKHYRVERAGSLGFEKVPVDASTRMPDGHMDSIEPFNYGELKPFSMAYMPGFLADKYDVEADSLKDRLVERCEKTFVDEAEATVRGYDTVHVSGQNIALTEATPHYAMLPVWLLCTKWQGKDFLFAMNGQTGKLVGDLPLDKGKYWGYFGVISVVLIALMFILNGMVLGSSFTGISMIVACVVLPIVISFIVCNVLKGQLKSVVSQRAAAYVAGTGLNLTKQNDVYVRTTTSTRDVN